MGLHSSSPLGFGPDDLMYLDVFASSGGGKYNFLTSPCIATNREVGGLKFGWFVFWFLCHGQFTYVNSFVVNKGTHSNMAVLLWPPAFISASVFKMCQLGGCVEVIQVLCSPPTVSRTFK